MRVSLGGWDLVALSDGCFRLDGGSMFGVIPKVLWERKKPADEVNRIRLGLNSLLLSGKGGVVLVEAGIGDKLDDRDKDIYGLERKESLLESLKGVGVDADDIDLVILSHLHLDHCGWATRQRGEGGISPTFPRARYVVQRREWEAALNPDRRSRASYDPRNFAVLHGGGSLYLADGEEKILPGLWVVPTGGHTPGHQLVVVEAEGERCVFLGDLVPTTAHLPVHWHMGWDLFPLDLMRVKEECLREALERRDLLFFTHEDGCPFVRLERVEGRLTAVPLA